MTVLTYARSYNEVYLAAFEARDELMITVNKYRKKTKQPVLDLKTSHDWKDVELSVQDACTGLEALATKDKDMSGSLGRVKRAFRSLCRNAGAGQTAATLIPNDSFGFTSVLCGSLKAVFTGLRTTGIYRQEVYRTLEDLPTRLKDLAADVKSHDRDEEVHRRAADLYVATFKLLNHILHWFLKNNWVTGVKIFTDPAGFTDRLRDCQAELKMASQSFEARLNKLSRDTEQETVQLQYWTTYSQASIHKKLETMEQRYQEERKSRIQVLEKLNLLLNHNSTFDTLRAKAIADTNSQRQITLPDIDPGLILARFLYDRDLVHNDCTALTKRTKRAHRTTQDASRLAALQTNPRLRAWLTVDEPSLLLVNGRAEPRPDSETSSYAAEVFEQLVQHHDRGKAPGESGAMIIPIGFFCGQHRDWQMDSNGSPEELAMSLLLQLIDRGHEVSDPTVLLQCYQRLKPGSIVSILAAFESLVLSLGSRVVLIVMIDGLRFFAQPRERCQGTREMVSRLVELFREEPAVTLKILFTSPTKCDFVEDLFAGEEILEMPRDISTAVLSSPARQRVVLHDQT
ncbi:hypothetical protein DE146DRAFT_604556 [Phaeosphaeria sp. MPI-PUGE-AT-0046c]|nr:hypothetical protein DE146DRAFT_604556 [Phaeosphaeria sp. MPI-PUGE-AT-0046c]